MRSGFLSDTSFDVDFQEIVKFGGKVDRIFEGKLIEEKLKRSHFENFFIDKPFKVRIIDKKGNAL